MPPDYEYAPLRIPPDTDRLTTQARLSIQAEFAGWELANTRLYRDGSLQITLRRPRGYEPPLPDLSY